MSRKVVLYIAMSVDGYIAKKDDDIAFLDKVDVAGEDYGYEEFSPTVDTIIWGRRTYDKFLSFELEEFPFKDKQVYVLSNTRTGSDEYVTYVNDLPKLITQLKQTAGKNIYCDGGGGLVAELLKHDLIDEMIVSVIPYLVGDGIRLFYDGRPEQDLELISSKAYDSGLVQLHYTRKRS